MGTDSKRSKELILLARLDNNLLFQHTFLPCQHCIMKISNKKTDNDMSSNGLVDLPTYMVGLEESILLQYWANQTVQLNNYCSQLDQLKRAINETSRIKRKGVIFHQVRLHVYLVSRQILLQLDWEVFLSFSIFIRYYTFGIDHSGLYRILLMKKVQIPWKIAKGTRKIKKSWQDKIMKLHLDWLFQSLQNSFNEKKFPILWKDCKGHQKD